MVDYRDLRRCGFRGVRRACHRDADGIRLRNGSRGDVVHLERGSAGNALARTRAHHADLAERSVSAGDAADAPAHAHVGCAENLRGERHAVICRERIRRWREADVHACLDGHRGLRCFRGIGLRRHCNGDGVWSWRRGRSRVSGRIGDDRTARSLRGHNGQCSASGGAATGAGKRPGENRAGIGTRDGRHGGEDGRCSSGGHALRSSDLQREIAGDDNGAGGLFRWVGDALRRQCRSCRRRNNCWGSVIAALVHRAAGGWARCPGETPAHGGVWMPGAGNRRLEWLRRAEFDGAGRRRNGDRDVACDGEPRCR